MADKKSFLLRMDRELLDAVQRWANDDLRSLNGQIEFLLRRALLAEGRTPKRAPQSRDAAADTAAYAPTDDHAERMPDNIDGPEL